MSHFTHMKTSFQNLFYLKKALNKLNIGNQEQEINLDQLQFNSKNINPMVMILNLRGMVKSMN